jgi:uncharacterized protein YpmS
VYVLEARNQELGTSLQPPAPFLMSRRFRLTILIGCATLAALIVIALAVFFSLRYEPQFYVEALAVDHESQKKASDEMLRRAAELVNDTKKRGKWQIAFTAQQINGWLAVDLVNNHPNMLPSYLSDPRVAINPDGVVLACRYKQGVVSSVLALTVEPYLPEQNAPALRIVSARAGLLPMPLGRVLDAISQAAMLSDWRIEWRQSGGDPVAMFRPPQPATGGPAVKIETVRVDKGEIFISGSTR